MSKSKIKLLFVGGMLVFVAILLNVFLKTEKQQKFLTLEKDNTTLFLENIMIREDGLFTLLGSKPMTLFDISESLSDTEDEIRQEYERSKAFIEKCKEDPEHFHSDVMVVPEFREFREKCLKHKQALQFHNHKKLWESWLGEKGCVSNQIYKIVSRGNSGLFINIPNTIYILKKHHVDFSEITGIKFDACKILDSIDDSESIFWNTVFKDHYLFGLLMGYGQKNSYLFDWAKQNSLSINAISIGRFKELSRLGQHVNLIRKIDVDVTDLEIPYFVSFEIDNETVERYSREREKIINFLKDKEWISFTISQLR